MTKPLLVDATRDLLPDEVWDRPKQGFVLPFADWMHGALAAEVDATLGDRRPAARARAEPGCGARRLVGVRRGRAGVTWSRPWALYSLAAMGNGERHRTFDERPSRTWPRRSRSESAARHSVGGAGRRRPEPRRARDGARARHGAASTSRSRPRTPRARASLDVPVDTPVIDDGVVYRYFARTVPGSWKFSWPMTRWLWANAGGYDVVHVHALFSYATIPGCRAAAHAPVPYVLRPLGTLSEWSLGHRRWKKRPYYALLERSHLEMASAIHVTSDAEAEDVARLGLRRPRARHSARRRRRRAAVATRPARAAVDATAAVAVSVAASREEERSAAAASAGDRAASARAGRAHDRRRR